ncbi:LacI family DNA-binding transcriptional regulator [Flavobacterium saccharophilum]|uniref:Transcriptional regulator, LacI family n=1 Tax=Flavobacterium saccharophilum TaxID=29534 RepID=A0A1M7GCD3_9FLAO|nr:LacI family DNA-binding transcriptional regulator [Flavobacterium saccharophilum]SHM13846.1 transcriptional regulator, LacI family [Flavobacterium saccharophilum]
MEESKDVTIYDIAERMNLATSTISRALKDHPAISDKTIKKVKKVAEEMGFRPNILAAGLRGNSTKIIGVLVTRINRPFISSLISGIEEIAQKEGYSIMITQSHDSYEAEVNLSKALYDSRVCGVICSLAMDTRDTSHFQKFIDKSIPLVFVDRVPKDFSTYRVMIDNYSAGYKATKHLIDQGCVRIAHITGSPYRNTYSERRRGYTDALLEANLTVNEELIIETALTYEEGETAATILFDLPNRPDGIFVVNDTAAVGVIQIAKKRGLKIPHDIAIIGFNDDPIASIIDPGLTTISHPAVKMGQTAARKILSHIKTGKKSDEVLKKDSITEVTFLNTQVLVRASSKRK